MSWKRLSYSLPQVNTNLLKDLKKKKKGKYMKLKY